ncbi:MarR family transcriptional regulator [Oxalobacteraceae bacterium]|nr:MarR family transcriptional regulator [Oxalobacteraceae bacterium]
MKKPSDTSSWPALLTAHAVLTERIEQQLARSELPPLAWYDVLWALERAPAQRLRMHELATHIVLTRSNLSRLVDRLQAAGLLERLADPEDKRGAYAVLTAQGLAMRRKIWPVYSSAIEALYDSHLDVEEQRVLNAALRKILDSARSAPRVEVVPYSGGGGDH